MAKTEVITPKTIRISFRQEKGDPDYGTCMWADFDFDTENYTLQIMSDCGNYSYGWSPTPQSESFFHLCRRLDYGYLIYKLADRTQIDDEETYKTACKLFEYDDDNLPDDWEGELKQELGSCFTEQDVVDVISGFASDNNIDLDGYDVWNCVEKDYTANAKKIVDVYMNHIIPVIPDGGHEIGGDAGDSER